MHARKDNPELLKAQELGRTISKLGGVLDFLSGPKIGSFQNDYVFKAVFSYSHSEIS